MCHMSPGSSDSETDSTSRNTALHAKLVYPYEKMTVNGSKVSYRASGTLPLYSLQWNTVANRLPATPSACASRHGMTGSRDIPMFICGHMRQEITQLRRHAHFPDTLRIINAIASKNTKRTTKEHLSSTVRHVRYGAWPAMAIPRHYRNKQIPNPRSGGIYRLTVAKYKGSRSSHISYPKLIWLYE